MHHCNSLTFVPELIGMVKKCSLNDRESLASLVESLADECEDDDDIKLQIVKSGLVENVFIRLLESKHEEVAEIGPPVVEKNDDEKKNNTNASESESILPESDAALRKLVFNLIVLLLISGKNNENLPNQGD